MKIKDYYTINEIKDIHEKISNVIEEIPLNLDNSNDIINIIYQSIFIWFNEFSNKINNIDLNLNFEFNDLDKYYIFNFLINFYENKTNLNKEEILNSIMFKEQLKIL